MTCGVPRQTQRVGEKGAEREGGRCERGSPGEMLHEAEYSSEIHSRRLHLNAAAMAEPPTSKQPWCKV